MNTLILTVGLPGSGKTHWSKEQALEPGVKHIQMDEFMFEDESYTRIKNQADRYKAVLSSEAKVSYDDKTLIIDAMLLTNDDIVRTLTNLPYLPDKTLEIHIWEVDREACLWNDRYRREENAEITIKNAQMEDINITVIEQILNDYVKEMKKDYPGRMINDYPFDIQMITHEVVRKEGWSAFAQQYELELNDYGAITSAPWRIGGHWWSYTGAEGDYEADPEPRSFAKLDELLDALPKSLSCEQNREVYNRCVRTEDESVRDYYSNEERRKFTCDIEKLYDLLDRFGVLEEE
jgi:predicted kinase